LILYPWDLATHLPQEIRLRHLSTIDGANAYLPEWIAAEHNRKFTIAARTSNPVPMCFSFVLR
jgi:hypothetical protein